MSQHPDYIPNVDLFPTKPATSLSIYQQRKQAALKRKAERAPSPLLEVDSNHVLDFSVTGPNMDAAIQELLPSCDIATAELEVLSDLESDELMALNPDEELPDITGPMDLDFSIPNEDEGNVPKAIFPS